MLESGAWLSASLLNGYAEKEQLTEKFCHKREPLPV